jgi:NAD(P)-dependent dehydrogenase (short-subunit alcohol dehydrogenase family)
MKLKDKVALVTGGARGTGAAIVDRYVAEGAQAAVADISFAHARETATRYGDKAFDVTKTASIEAAVESVVQRWGGVDILVNNAAIFDMSPIVEVTEASYDRVFAVNVKGLFFTLQAVAERMIARGQGGRIINHGFAGRQARRSFGADLLRLEGRRHQPHPIGRAGPHQAPHQRQRHCPRRRRYSDVE